MRRPSLRRRGPHPGRAPLARALVLAGLAGIGGLPGEGGGAAIARGGGPRARSATPALDVVAAAARARLAFRAEGGGWVGGHDAYAVRATTGALRIAPVQGGEAGRPLQIETVSIARGGRAIGAGPAAGRVEPDGHLAIARGAAVEHLRLIEGGVEQSFSYAERPEGGGDLVVRLRASGPPSTGETAGGHHFADAATGLGLRYGAATWIDARGERTPVRVHYDERAGELALSVPAATVDGSEYPAVLDPLISPEIGLDAAALTGAPPGWRQSPAVAWNGSSYLIVWGDTRFREFGSCEGEASKDHVAVIGARIGPDGAMLPPGAFLLGGHLSGEAHVAAAAAGSTFFVVWESHDAAGSRGIEGVRVSDAGDVLDPIPIAEGPGDQTRPAIAWGGGELLVAWQDVPPGGSGDIRGARLDPAGGVLDPGGIPIASAPHDQGRPAIAFDGSSFVVAWDDTRNGTSRDVYAARVSPAGQVLDPGGIAVSTAPSAQMVPGVASVGAGSLLVWRDHRSGASDDIYGARLSAAGEVLDPGGIAISTAAGSQASPSVAAAASDYLVSWADARAGADQIYGARVGSAGTVLDPSGFLISPTMGSSSPAVASGNGWLVAWHQGPIRAARVAEDGGVLDPGGIDTPRSDHDETPGAAAWNGASYLAVFFQPDDLTIYGVRVSAAGAILDPAPIPIAVGVTTRWLAAASDGSDFFVVWSNEGFSDPDTVRAARVSGDAVVLDPEAIVLSDAETMPVDVAFGGGVYLVVGATLGGRGVRVSPAGEVLDPTPLQISPAPPLTTQGVTYDGENFAVVWDGVAGGAAILGGRVTPGGVVLDPDGFLIAEGAEPVARLSPDVAFDGSDLRVAWIEGDVDGDSYNHRIRSARVSTAGAVLETTAAIPAPAWRKLWRHRGLDVTCGGGTCLLLWQTWRGLARGYEHHGAWAGPPGVSGIPWSPFALPESFFKGADLLGAGGPGDAFLALYSRYDAEAGAMKAKARLLSRPLVGPCQADLDCATGFCADGVCCDSACGGGDPDDCLACSVAAGAPADGVCAPRSGPCSAGPCAGAGTCQGGACVAPAKPDGAPCGGGECVREAICQGGACAVTFKDDLVICDGGACMGGECVPFDCCGAGCKPDPGSSSTGGGASSATSAGAGGAGGEGGLPAGSGGSGAAPAAPAAPLSLGGGCACRAAGPAPVPPLPGGIALLALALSQRRRRARAAVMASTRTGGSGRQRIRGTARR